MFNGLLSPLVAGTNFRYNRASKRLSPISQRIRRRFTLGRHRFTRITPSSVASLSSRRRRKVNKRMIADGPRCVLAGQEL